MLMLTKLAWRNIGRGWRRSAIVLSAIAVGLSACVLVVAWTKGMMFQMADNAIRMQLAHLAIQAVGYQQSPDVELNLGSSGDRMLAIASAREGLHASARLRGEGLVQSARHSLRVAIFGVAPRAEAAVSVVPGALVAGRFLSDERVRGPRQLPPLAVGRAMAERLRGGLGDKVVLHVPGEGGLGAFRVRGIFRTSSTEFDRTVAYMSLGDARRLFGVEGVTEIAITLDRPEDSEAVQAWLVGEAERVFGPGVVEVLRWQDREPRLATMLEFVAVTYPMFYGVVFVAMAFGIANALMMSVYERIREFGVMRSLGLDSRRLVALVLLESLVLTLAGTALGLGIGLPLVEWLSRVGIDMRGFSSALEGLGIGTTIYPVVDAEDVVTPIGLALVTGLLAALWPALKAVRLRPAQALRAT